MMGRVKKELWIGAAVFLVFAVLGALLSEVGITFLSRIVIMALYALSFNLMFGYAGMSSVGHALYFGFGGYALMVYLTKLQVPLLPACILSVLTVIPVAWFLGTACLKNNMLTFSFLTMGLCTTVQLVLYKTAQLGGTVGFTYYFLPSWMSGYRQLFFFILICAGFCAVLIYLLVQSPYVQMLKGIRENDERMTFLGVNVRKMRVSIFVISAVFANIAGILYAFRNSGAYTTSLDANVSMQAIMMCVVGGRSVFLGPVLGSVIITTIQNYLSVKTMYYEGIIGVIIVLTAYYLREGLLGKGGPLDRLIKRLHGRQDRPADHDSE